DFPAPMDPASAALYTHSGDCPVDNEQQPQPSDDPTVWGHSGQTLTASAQPVIHGLRRAASLCVRKLENSAPGFQPGQPFELAILAPSRQATLASCAEPSKVQCGSNSSFGWW